MAIGTRSLSMLCRRLGTGLRSGLDPVRLWDQEQKTGPPSVKKYAGRILEDIRQGHSMAGAIRRCEGFFPAQVAEIVDVGEETGRLAEVLLRMADQLEHRLKVRRNFMLAITWPAFELVIAVGVMGVFLLLLQMIIPSGSPFGPHAFRNYVLVVAAVSTLFTLVAMAVLRGWLGGILTRPAMKIPVIGPTYRAGAMARLTWTFAAALDAGVDARRSVRMAMESTQNEWFAKHAPIAMEEVRQGKTFHEAFGATGIFNDDFLMALNAAEISGTYAEAMRRLAEEFQEEFERRTRLLAMFAGFAVWVLIAMLIIGFIGFIVVKIIMPPYQEAFEMLDGG